MELWHLLANALQHSGKKVLCSTTAQRSFIKQQTKHQKLLRNNYFLFVICITKENKKKKNKDKRTFDRDN